MATIDKVIETKFIEYPGQPVYESAEPYAQKAITAIRIFQMLILMSATIAFIQSRQALIVLFNSEPGYYYFTMVCLPLAAIFPVVFFIFWLHRSYNNLAPLGWEGHEYASAWAYWGFIMAPFNLFMPYFIAIETWIGSRTREREQSDATALGLNIFPSYITAWWVICLFSIVFLPGFILFVYVFSKGVLPQFFTEIPSNVISELPKKIASKYSYLVLTDSIQYLCFLMYVGSFIGAHLSSRFVREVQRYQQEKYSAIDIKNWFTRKPVCPVCGAELRTRYARQCPECHLDWHH